MTRESAGNAIASVTTGLNDAVADCDLIIEAALERMDLKRELFKNLQNICRTDAIFATNTSSLSITELSAGLDRPVIGMHFFNPAPVMKLVELVVVLTHRPNWLKRSESLQKTLEKFRWK